MESSARSTWLATVLIAFPVAAMLLAILLAVVAWPHLPTTLVTHWGAGGADGRMPRAWAVGLALAMSILPTMWAIVRAVAVRGDLRRVFDTAIVSGLVAWMGLGALASSVWAARNESTVPVVALVLILPLVLTAMVGRYGWTRLPKRISVARSRRRSGS